jgi:hypothetical protein
VSASPLLATTTATAVVWLTIGLVSTLAFAIMLIALVRHVLVLMRAVGRFQDELSPILEEMTVASDAARRAGARSSGERASTRP